MKKKIKKELVEDILPLLPLQKSMLYHYLRDPNPELYNEINCYTIKGNISIEAFQKAWEFVFQHNGVLRTVFRWTGLREPVQIVLKETNLNFEVVRLEDVEQHEFYLKVDHYLTNLRKLPYDLTQETLRIKLLIQDDNNAVMITANHHILYDGWSNAILLYEFKRIYEDLILGKDTFSVLKPSYPRFLHSYFQHNRTIDYEYWGKCLSGYEAPPHAEVTGMDSQVFNANVTDSTWMEISAAAKEHGISPSTYFYLAWAITMSIVEKKNKVIFGITLSGRSEAIPGVERIAGLLIGTAPFVIELNEESEISSTLKQVNTSLILHQEKRPDSFSDVYAKLNLPPRLYQSVVVIQNYPLHYEYLKKPTVLAIDIYKRFYQTELDLNLSIRQFDSIELDIEYNSLKYTEAEIHRTCGIFIKVLEELGKNANCVLKELLCCLSGGETQQLHKLGGFNL